METRRQIALATLVAFLLSQLSKFAVIDGLNLREVFEIKVFPPLLTFRMGWNEGVNFGLFSDANARWILIAVALVLVGAIYVWLMREKTGRIGALSGGILMGGALSNVADRLLYGAVADFLNVSCCGISNPFIFNVADIAVFAGAAGLILFTGSKKP
jgi:signal peptidase II